MPSSRLELPLNTFSGYPLCQLGYDGENGGRSASRTHQQLFCRQSLYRLGSRPWCEQPDFNRYGFLQTGLSRSRLAIPPCSQNLQFFVSTTRKDMGPNACPPQVQSNEEDIDLYEHSRNPGGGATSYPLLRESCLLWTDCIRGKLRSGSTTKIYHLSIPARCDPTSAQPW